MAQRKSSRPGKTSRPASRPGSSSGAAGTGAAKATSAAESGSTARTKAAATPAATTAAGAAAAGVPAGKAAGKTAAKATGGGKSGSKSGSKSGTTKGSSRGTAGGPPSRKKPKSIVNQKQTPWGLIATTAAIVIFAVAVVAVVIATRPSADAGTQASKGGQTVKSSDPWRQPELPAAAAIKGVSYRVQGVHTHVDGKVKYDTTPPTGGLHSAYWADCSGTVYDKAIANENAVHMLEHGAVWITYNPDEVKGADLAKLKSYVSGVDRMAMSPYPNLSTPISLQAWGYELKVTSANDPRIAAFIKALRYNQKTTPEPNATCSQPTFKASPSTFGNPKEGP